MACEHAELALRAGNVDLLDLTEKISRSGDTSSKWNVAMSSSEKPLKPSSRVIPKPPLRDVASVQASAASFLPFSTACSMVPTM